MFPATGERESSSAGDDRSMNEEQVEEEENVVVGEDVDNGENGEGGGKEDVMVEEEIDAFLRPDWSSSLSESELDMLVYLKHLAVVQTRNAGCEELIEKFDDSKLRLLGSFLTAYLKERLKAIGTENFRPFDGFKLLLSEHERHLRSVAYPADVKQSNRTTRKRKRKGKE